MKVLSIRVGSIAVAIVAIGAFALVSMGGATAQQACIQPLVGGGTFNGTWDDSCLSENEPLGDYNYPSGTRYARFYTFTLSAPLAVTMELQSSTDTYMYLMQGTGKTGTVLHYNDDIVVNENANSRISESLPAGDYTIEATTYEVETAGNFTLTVSGLPDAVTPTFTPTPGVGNTPTVTPTPVLGQLTPVATATEVPRATDTPVPTPSAITDDLLGRLSTVETRVATQHGAIATMESKVIALNGRVATLEAGAANRAATTTPLPTVAPISTPVPTTTPIKTATPPPGNLGAKTNPVPLGQYFRAPSSPWELKVNEVDWDAWPEILESGNFPHPPTIGYRYITVNVSVRNIGDTPDNFNVHSGNRIGTLGASLVSRNNWNSRGTCRNNRLPERLYGDRDIFPGGVLTGKVCFEVLVTDLDSLLLYGDYNALDLTDRTYEDNLWFWSLR